MRFFASAFVVLLAAAATAQDVRLSAADRAHLAGRVYGAAVQYFAHWQDAPELDVDRAFHRYAEQAMASDDRLAFGLATMEFLAAFRNSHTLLIDRAAMVRNGPLPFDARFLSGRWVIAESWVPGLKPGDLIEAIDGKNFETFYGERRRYISASTERWQRRALFARAPGFEPYAHLLPERFVLRLDGGRDVTVDRKLLKTAQPLATEGRWLEQGKVAYIRVPTFFVPEAEKKALELLNQFRDAAALIVDVRGNNGGSTPGELTRALMNKPYRWWTESTPVVMPYFRLRAGQGQWEYQPFARPELLWRNAPQQPGKDAFQGRLILLVDGACHSACEDFVMPFKDNRRAVLIGEATAGSTGQPYMLDLGRELMVLIGAKREMFPDGSQFESVGIKPDTEILPAPADFTAGRDPVLEAARKQASAR